MRVFGVLLLIATGAQAQPLVGPEVVWRTTSPAVTYHPAPRAAPVAADGDAFVVTWSEVADGASRAFAGRLDGSGRLETVGVRTSGTADAAAIVPFAGRYVTAWLEPELTDGRPLLVTGALDRGFHLLSSRTSDFLSEVPIVRANQGHAFVATGTVLYEVDRDGVPILASYAPSRIDDVAIAGDQAGYVSHQVQLVTICFFGCGTHIQSTVQFNWLSRLTANATFDFVNVNAPVAIGSNGTQFLVVWFDDVKHAVMGTVFGFQFNPFIFSLNGPARLGANVQAQVAWDGEHWVVVWPRDGSIEGAEISPGGARTTFTVSSRGARPAIASARQGRFVVTYETTDGAERRLVSRVLDFHPPPPGRERAVR